MISGFLVRLPGGPRGAGESGGGFVSSAAGKLTDIGQRYTHVPSKDEPEGWRRPAEGINKFYRTFDAWFGNKTTPKNGFIEPSPEEKFADRPEFTPESLHKTAMIGTPDEIIERLRHYKHSASPSSAYGPTTASPTRKRSAHSNSSSNTSCRPSKNNRPP